MLVRRSYKEHQRRKFEMLWRIGVRKLKGLQYESFAEQQMYLEGAAELARWLFLITRDEQAALVQSLKDLSVVVHSPRRSKL